ncbi:hypothetical protein BKA66DRAFT_476620 [Pyrenochaeta sp. MPI-SDFR-AT-0127]|nr:hypothetical protein BKA66DRAFT_476620 [Pyrenochaeta sp. MPI-SDFR-AT-0127]
MMSWANTYICDSMATNFTSVPQGDRCGTKTEWKALGKAVESLCNQQRVGTVLVQSVNLICHAKSTLEGNVEECAGGNSSVSSTVGHSTTINTSRSTVAVSSSLPAQSSAAALSSDSLPNSSPSLSTFESSVPTTVSTIASIASLPPHSRITATPKGSSVNHIATYTGWLANTDIGRPPPTPLASDSSVSMITFSTPAPYVLVTTDVPTTTPYANSASPKHNGLSRSWEIYEPWPIPLGYYGSTLVPAAHQTGQISHYDPATNLAYPACEPQGGHYLQPNELGVAISWQLLDWQRGNLCNRKILAWWDGGENLKGETSSQAVFRVRDGCTACRPSDLDIFEHVWGGIVAPNGLGRAHVTWRWMHDDEVASATAGG